MIIFRCDSSSWIGDGHIKRCLYLAKELRNRGEICEFISVDYEGNAIEEVISNGFKVSKISRDLYKEKNIAEIDKFKREKIINLEADAQETINLLLERIPEYVIVDHYDLDINWEKRVKEFCKKIFVIDDLANRKHDCDILLDHNLKEDILKKYINLTSNNCIQLLGLDFALLDSIYNKTQKKIINRKGKIKNILISFAGGDLEGMTLMTLKAFTSLNIKNIFIEVIVKKESPNFKEIQEITKHFKNIKIYNYQKTLIPFIARADYAIGGAGMSCLERCCLGLPSTVISLAKNQEHVIKFLSEKKIIK